MTNAAQKRREAERRALASGQGQGETSKTSSVSSPSSANSSLRSPRNTASPPSRFDGNRDPESSTQAGATHSTTYAVSGPSSIVNKNLDLGGAGAAFMMGGLGQGLKLPSRWPKGNSSGREVFIKLNTFNVQSYPQKPVYQYDVLIGNGAEKKGLNKTCWEAPVTKAALGQGWIYDGSRLAWSLNKVDKDIRLSIDTDEAKGQQARPKPEIVKCQIKFAKTISFTSLRNYLEGTLLDFDIGCLESINFLDHLMRETPGKKYVVQKRSFFDTSKPRFTLGGGVEAMKGVYASMRLSHPSSLSVNVDVANTCFWAEAPITRTAALLLRMQDDKAALVNTLRAGQGGTWQFSHVAKYLKKVLIFTHYMKGQSLSEAQQKPMRIDRMLNQTSKQVKITVKINESSPEKEMTIFDYFNIKHGVRLQYPDLPLLEMDKKIRGKPIKLPMEVCFIQPNQRYIQRLSDIQTTEMLKFAVTLPEKRWTHVEDGLKMLDWKNDKYLINYGLSMKTEASVAPARVLPPPKVMFGGSGSFAMPGTSGRWDLRNKKFYEPYKDPLDSWGFCLIPGRGQVQEPQLQNFIRVFISTMEGHGCRIKNKTPVIVTGTQDAAKNVEALYQRTGKSVQKDPQILFFVVTNKDADYYRRLKKSCDCRYGVASQVVQASNVQKAQPQYCSNVAMKVNAKLGGTTSRAVGTKGNPGSWFKVPTMIIGADVSHGSQGEEEPASTAAFTMSFDRHAAKYISRVDTNGFRIEMIMKDNIDNHLKKMAQAWQIEIGGGKLPQHVIYVRDGVSEGQYSQVLNQEVRDMSDMFSSIDSAAARNIKWTVLMGSKRHHVRFFPQPGAGDKNGNPLPGTLVETAVTHPRERDFYLCAHSAIKGTARPVHYHVLRDDLNMPPEDLQNMLYESSYQYVRSTTPVSLFPAAYYAHLAAYRGIAHRNTSPTGQGSGPGQPPAKSQSSGSIEVKKALPLHGNKLWKAMWFV